MRLSSKHFKCSYCGHKQDHVVWDNQESTGVPCINNCGTILTLSMIVQKKKTPKAPGIRTPTKNRV